MADSRNDWACLWKAAAKRWRGRFAEVLDDYHGLIEEMAGLGHAEELERWLQGFRRRVARKKWRSSDVWRAWYVLKYRQKRLEHLRALQAPQVIVRNEIRLVEKAQRNLNSVLFLAKLSA